jgi:hypothetical protein
MTFLVALSTVQSEMIAVFAHELADEHRVEKLTARNMAALSEALQAGSRKTFDALDTVVQELDTVIDHVTKVRVGIERLARLSLNGRVEVATVPDAGSIRTLFSDVERQIVEARDRLSELALIKQASRDLELASRHQARNAADRLQRGAEALMRAAG